MKIERIIDVDKFTQEIQEDIKDVGEAMRTQTARTAYYAMLHTQAEKQAAQMDLQVKVIEAHLTKHYRKALADAAEEYAEENGTKPEKVTVDQVKAEVMLDHRMRKIIELQMDANEVKAICRAAYDAFRTRRDMLVSLGHLATAQMKTGHEIIRAKDAVSSYKQRRAARRGEVAEEE